MNPVEAAAIHFVAGRVMQLATIHDGQPRVNSVYYVISDDIRSVYWLSEPWRRHSVDLRTDDSVAGAIAVKSDQPVIGLQFAGKASEVGDKDEIKIAVSKYNEKYQGAADGFDDRFAAGINKHLFYKMDITSLELFDEVNFSGGKIIDVQLG